MRRHGWVAIAALVLALAPVGAPAQAVDVRERARAALPGEVFEAVERIAAGAERDGLPVGPLWDKALEGAAKRVPPARIAPALAEYADRLGVARGALGGDAAPGVIVAGADALRRGVPAPALAQVREGGRTSMALVVLADLVETGVPAERAVGVVRAALEQRTADEEMLALASRVRAAIRRGESAGTAAEEVRRALREPDVGGRSATDRSRPPTRPATEPGTRQR